MSRPGGGLLLALLLACGGAREAPPAGGDSSFAALQRRGAAAMGVDQYTSAHRFEPLPDGGRIVLQREVEDSAGAATIRSHLEDIASRFGRGDFSLPGFVHAGVVPGTTTMAARRALIEYRADTLPRGGEVRIRSSDSTAIAAIHAFLAFQRLDHRTGDHTAHPRSP
jgi:hypothetical protein